MPMASYRTPGTRRYRICPLNTGSSRCYNTLRTTESIRLFYARKEFVRNVPFPYSNSDLPDLRAQFIRREFVESVVRQTSNASRCHIYVLHNEPIPEVRQEQLRKVQVYVMVYLKPTNS